MKRKKKILMLEPHVLARILDPWFVFACRSKVDRREDHQVVRTNIYGNFWDAMIEHQRTLALVGAYSRKSTVKSAYAIHSTISGYVERYGKNPTGKECIRFVFHEDYWFKVFPGSPIRGTFVYQNPYIRSDINIETYIPGR
jgi:hypothetical protein